MSTARILRTETDWLAVVTLDDGRWCSLSYQDEPTEAQAIAAAEAAMVPPETEFEIECEDGTVVS